MRFLHASITASFVSLASGSDCNDPNTVRGTIVTEMLRRNDGLELGWMEPIDIRSTGRDSMVEKRDGVSYNLQGSYYSGYEGIKGASFINSNGPVFLYLDNCSRVIPADQCTCATSGNRSCKELTDRILNFDSVFTAYWFGKLLADDKHLVRNTLCVSDPVIEGTIGWRRIIK